MRSIFLGLYIAFVIIISLTLSLFGGFLISNGGDNTILFLISSILSLFIFYLAGRTIYIALSKGIKKVNPLYLVFSAVFLILAFLIELIFFLIMNAVGT